MSDVFEGPGYWMASDAKWYPPEQHPDPTYRARFMAVQSSDPMAREQPSDVSVGDSDPGSGEFPTVELSADETVSPGSGKLSDIHHTAESNVDSKVESMQDDASSAIAHSEDSAAAFPPAFSVKSNSFNAAPERPVFEVSTPRSVVSPPQGPAPKKDGPTRPRVELEMNRGLTDSQRPGTHERITPPTGRLSSSTALAVIPAAVVADPEITIIDRLLAALVFCAGVAMIVGTFLDWTIGSLVQTGWDRGDGIATIIAGVVGSAAAGPVYVGYRHILPKSIAIVAGLVGLVVIGLTAISVLTDSASANTSLGAGFIVVLVGAAAMTAGGVLYRGELTL